MLSAVLPSVAAGFSLKSAESIQYSDNYIRSTSGKLSVFVVNAFEDNAKLCFTSDQDSLYNCKWYSFSNSSEELTLISKGTSTNKGVASLGDLNANSGYAVEFENADGEKSQFYVWLTKYEPITSVSWSKEEYYCERLPLHISPVMFYKELQGFDAVVKRTEEVKYAIFEMENGTKKDARTDELTGDSVLYIPSVPTVDTRFEMTNVDFGTSFVSDTFVTLAVNAFPVIVTDVKAVNEADEENLQTDEDGNVVLYFDNQSGSFRSSGPLTLTIKANISPKVNDLQWWFSSDSSFNNPKIIYKNSKAISGNNYNLFNFEQLNSKGRHCVKLVAKNLESDCVYESATCFSIKQSHLYIPNTFTPNADNNKEFMVAFESIKDFEIRIYNQAGRKVFETTDITKGWDGTYNGNDLPTGVYFYVIKANGIDGVKYNKKGTINLIRYVD